MNIPQTWTLAQLGNLTAQIVGGGTPSKTSAANFNGHIPFMTVKDLKARFVSSTVDHISEDALQSSATTKVPADTLIVATRMSLGKIARPTMDVAINQDLKALFLHSGVNKTFVEYFWRSKSQAIQSMGTGTTVKGIRLEDIRTLEVPLAPEAEQKRIADKLDTVLTRVDAVNTCLARVAPLLKRFRQSVLAAATSGRLTEDWRNGSIPEVKEWSEKALSEVCRTITDGEHISPPLVPHGVPLVSAKDVREWGVDFSDTKFVSEEFAGASRKRCGPICGDVLVVSRGATVGRTCLVKSKEKFCLMGSVLLFQPTATLIKSEFLAHVLASPLGLEQLTKASGATAQAAIYIRDAKGLKIRLPGIDEQTEIVHRVETLFAFADRLQARLAQAQTAATRLTPALLAKAFRGELVPQDPNDEPAAELLRRLQAQRATGAPASKTGAGRGRGRKAALAADL
jgi:type I restriction enzyme S subunit